MALTSSEPREESGSQDVCRASVWAIFELNRALSALFDAAGIYAAALTALKRALKVERASVLLFDPDGVMRFKAWRGLSEAYRAKTSGHTPWTPDSENARPLLVSDVVAEPELEALRPTILAEGIRALAFIPLLHHQRVLGKFMLYYAEPHQFSDEEVLVAQTIAGHIAFALDRLHREETLRAQQGRLEVALQAGRLGAWEWDLSSGRVSWSPTLEAIHGLEPGSFDGSFEGYQRDIHSEDRSRVLQTIKETLEQGTEHYLHYRIVRPDGEVRWLEARGRQIRDAAGQIVKLTGVCMDVTERKQVEEAEHLLARAGQVLATSLEPETTLNSIASLLTSSLVDYCVVDTVSEDGSIARLAAAHRDPFFAPLMQQLMQYPPSLLGSHPLVEVLQTGQPILIPEVTPAVVDSYASNPEHLLLLRQLQISSIMSVPMQARGRSLGVITCVTTHGRHRFSQADLALGQALAYRAALALDNARLYKEAREAIQARDEFLSVASHELRTPLTTLSTHAQMLLRQARREGQLDQQRALNSLRSIDREADRLARLIMQLLDISRLEGGKLRLARQETDLRQLADEVAASARARTDRHEISVQGPVPLPALVDALRIEQVLTNLVDNAIKYSPEGGPIEVELRSTMGQEAEAIVEIDVCDHGLGIPPERRAGIFERFYQAHGSSHTSGMGLGLYISRQIVELHGGQLRAEFPETGGSRFIIRLPVG